MPLLRGNDPRKTAKSHVGASPRGAIAIMEGVMMFKRLARAISAVGIAEKSYSADPSNELNLSLAKAHKEAVDRTITLFEERIQDVRLKQRQLQSLESRQAASDLIDQIVKDFNGLASKADAMLDPESQ